MKQTSIDIFIDCLVHCIVFFCNAFVCLLSSIVFFFLTFGASHISITSILVAIKVSDLCSLLDFKFQHLHANCPFFLKQQIALTDTLWSWHTNWLCIQTVSKAQLALVFKFESDTAFVSYDQIIQYPIIMQWFGLVSVFSLRLILFQGDWSNLSLMGPLIDRFYIFSMLRIFWNWALKYIAISLSVAPFNSIIVNYRSNSFTFIYQVLDNFLDLTNWLYTLQSIVIKSLIWTPDVWIDGFAFSHKINITNLLNLIKLANCK